MSAKITTQYGHSIPPAPRHSVTVHIGGWDTIEKFGTDPRAVIASWKTGYPRIKLHQDIGSVRLPNTPSRWCG